jgi:hypothetical protein
MFWSGIFVGLMPNSVSKEKGMEQSPFQYSSLLKNLHTKLDPRRFYFAWITPQMSAFIGYVLGVNYGIPTVEEVVVVYDGAIIGRTHGSGKPVMLGHYDEFVRAWKYLLSVAGLTFLEWMAAESRFAARVGYVFEPPN